MLDCWLVESPSTVFCRFGGWSLGRFVCCHLAVTWSHCEGISMDKCHGSWSHSKRCETCNGSHGQTKRPRRNDVSETCHGAHCNKCDGHPQRNPLQGRIALHNDESLCFIMIDRHDSSWWFILVNHDNSSRWTSTIRCDASWWFIMMESSWWVMMIRQCESSGFIVMKHHYASSWLIMMIHHDESWWIMMIHHHEAPRGPEMIPSGGSIAFLLWVPWHFPRHLFAIVAFLPWLPCACAGVAARHGSFLLLGAASIAPVFAAVLRIACTHQA